MDLEVEDDKFKGYDYGANCRFDGKVSGNSVSLYDYGESSYFEYSIERHALPNQRTEVAKNRRKRKTVAQAQTARSAERRAGKRVRP